MTQNGFKDASADRERIRAWWTKTPSANVGIACGASGIAVLDVDHGLSDLEAFHAWRTATGLPDTYTVRTGRRPEFGAQMYFAGPVPDVGLFELNGCSGQIKSLGGYVMSEGCLHPSGETYQAISTADLAPIPDVVRNLRTSKKLTESKPGEKIRAGEGQHAWLTSKAGSLRNMGLDEDALEEALTTLSENMLDPPLPAEDIRHVAESIGKKPLPAPEPVLLIGGRRPALGAPGEAVEELLAEKTVRPIFPDQSWAGTIYGAFADIVCRGNDIPRKFAAEPFRMITGSLVGNQVSCGVSGVRMREFGVIIGPPQSGKSVGLEDAEQFYSTEDPLLWHYMSSYRPRGIGAQKFLPGSGNSFADQLQREENERGAALIRKNKQKAEAAIEIEINDVPTQWGPSARYITIQGEAMALLARFGNDWTGQALASNLTDLYDGESTEVPITKERGCPKIKVKLQYAMLLCTQPHIWRKYVAESLVDSGLFGRFYIVGSDRAVRQEQLPDYAFPEIFEQDFGALRRDAFARIIYLADHPLLMTVSPEARQRLGDWEKAQAALTPLDHIDRSRLGLHVWRAAMARAWGWMPQRTEITLEDAEAAILLGEYQVKMRQFYAPSCGDDRDATAINTLRQAVQIAGRLSMRELKLKVHAARMGRRFNTALEYLTREGEIAVSPGSRKNQQVVGWVQEEK
jgi:putative DNA primase/helicase